MVCLFCFICCCWISFLIELFMVGRGVVRRHGVWLNSACWEGGTMRTLDCVFWGAGGVAGTEINRGLMMAMMMEEHGHFLESLSV